MALDQVLAGGIDHPDMFSIGVNLQTALLGMVDYLEKAVESEVVHKPTGVTLARVWDGPSTAGGFLGHYREVREDIATALRELKEDFLRL